jgi:hypothetical protein
MIYTVAPFATSVEEIIMPMPFSEQEIQSIPPSAIDKHTVPPPVTTATTPRRSKMLLAVRDSRMVLVSAMGAKA